MNKGSRGLFLMLVIAVFSLSAVTVFSQEKDKKEEENKKKETFTAVVVGTGGGIGARTMNLNIYINSYTSDQEVQEYLTVLKEKGQDELRRMLEKVEVGRIAPAAGVGVDLAIARSFQTPEGRVVRVGTLRPMSFLELYRGGRSTNYPFTFVELRLDQEGKGEGSILGGTQVKFNKEGQLELESYGNQYAKLSNVKAWD